MDDRRMPLLSILYQLVRWLLGLITVLMHRDLSKDAELLVLRQENAVLRRQIARVRYAPANRGVAGGLVPAAATLPLGRGLSGYSGHDPGLDRRLVARKWDYTARRICHLRR
jgi:putative transposase